MATSSNAAAAASTSPFVKEMPGKLALRLNMDPPPDYLLCFTSGDAPPVPVHSLILRLNSTVMGDLLPSCQNKGAIVACAPYVDDSKHSTIQHEGVRLNTDACSIDHDIANRCAIAINEPAMSLATLTLDGSRAAWLEILMRCYGLHPAVEDLVIE